MCFARFDVLALTVQMMFRVICPVSISHSTRLRFQYVIVCGLALWNLGCGEGPQAEFKLRDSTNDLISDANKAVTKTLKDDFGTPNNLIAWERFPVNYGGAKGIVSSIADDKSIVVTVDGDSSKVRKGAAILWVSGSLASDKPSVETVAGFNAETNQLALSSGSGTPAVGDRFVIGFGEDLQLGRHVYMKNCMHCHGVAGDGAGPTGQFLNPRPRDYRSGVFKFTSTRPGEKPTRDDLDRIVKYGIPGTYMPSFLLLGDHETKAVVEYVRWLSIRGEFEKRLVNDLSGDYSKKSIADSTEKANAAYAEKQKEYLEKQKEYQKQKKGDSAIEKPEAPEKPPTESKATKIAKDEFAKYSKEDYPAGVEETANFLADAWTRAEALETIIIPSVHRVEDTAESRERGRMLFMSDKTKCYTCHGMTGRGDGGATEDFWPKPGSQEKYDERGLHDEWGHILKPRNLTLGQYRGGRRPVDIFRRMYAGIKGTPMPAFGGTALKDPEIWDLVNYVMSLPYASKQPPATGPGGHVAKNDEKPAH